MNNDIIKAFFGNNHSRIWKFKGSVSGDDHISQITEKFATAIGTNLVDCNVVRIAGSWYAHTKNMIDIDSDEFQHFIDLPLTEPEIEEESSGEESSGEQDAGQI